MNSTRFTKLSHLTLAIALAGLSAATLAATPLGATREERMDTALQNYRSQQGTADASSSSSEGPVARSGHAIKRGVTRAGEAIKHGAQKTGHAIGKGVSKTGEAIHHAGEKMEGKKPDTQ